VIPPARKIPPPRFATIVADPPWREGAPSGSARPMLGYPQMTVAQLAKLPIAGVALPDAHLFVWTTQRYLWQTPALCAAWGFADVVKLLTWAKPPTGFSVGPAIGNASEFVIWARRGRPATRGRVPRDWWEWPRRGEHSQKPDAFLDVVEQITPGPRLEIFARRARLGWEYAGDGSLGTIAIPGLREPDLITEGA
jgi:N6-adenosine-specific RNA methylase IME4